MNNIIVILLSGLLLSGCGGSTEGWNGLLNKSGTVTTVKTKEFAKVGDKVLDYYKYVCDFGVLYYRDVSRNYMVDREGKPIPCTIVKLTKEQYNYER